MHQELALTQGIAVENIAFFIRANMNSRRKQLAIFDITIGVLEIDASLPETFDFRSKKRDACLISILDEKIMARFRFCAMALFLLFPHNLRLAFP